MRFIDAEGVRSIVNALVAHQEIKLKGLGSFSVAHRDGFGGKRRSYVVFVADSSFESLVNGGRLAPKRLVNTHSELADALVSKRSVKLPGLGELSIGAAEAARNFNIPVFRPDKALKQAVQAGPPA